ncbi:acyltransferase family protein [Methanobrevibacter sp.]
MEVTERLNKYDNLRGIGIFLVVIVHINVLGAINGFAHNLFVAIMLPLLFYVAGYFSKIGSEEILKSFKRLLIPYMVFYIIVKIFRFIVLGKPLTYQHMFFTTISGLWFLMALFIMKMILPIFNKLKYPILTSIILSLAMGFIDLDSGILGLTRVFGYLPIFLVGFYHKQTKNNITTEYTKIVNFFNKHYKIISILIIILAVIACYKFPIRIFRFTEPYSGNLLYEMIKRLIVVVAEIGIVLVFDKFMTNKNCLLTQFGKNSLAVYLLQYYFMICLKEIIPNSLKSNMPLCLILTFGLSFIITYLLSRDVVTKYINKLTDGVYNIIAKPI